MSDLQRTMGTTIRRERRDRRLTLRELAERAALSVVYLGEIERGKKYPSARVLEHLAEAMDLEVPDLLEIVAIELRQEQDVTLAAPIGFVRPSDSKNAPRASVGSAVNLLRPMEVAIMGAFFTVQERGVKAR